MLFGIAIVVLAIVIAVVLNKSKISQMVDKVEEAVAPAVATAVVVTKAQIKPQEQLAMVLPLESWYLLRDPLLRTLPSKMPQFWPRSFGFISLGKAWMWECEADIPILCHGRL